MLQFREGRNCRPRLIWTWDFHSGTKKPVIPKKKVFVAHNLKDCYQIYHSDQGETKKKIKVFLIATILCLKIWTLNSRPPFQFKLPSFPSPCRGRVVFVVYYESRKRELKLLCRRRLTFFWVFFPHFTTHLPFVLFVFPHNIVDFVFHPVPERRYRVCLASRPWGCWTDKRECWSARWLIFKIGMGAWTKRSADCLLPSHQFLLRPVCFCSHVYKCLPGCMHAWSVCVCACVRVCMCVFEWRLCKCVCPPAGPHIFISLFKVARTMTRVYVRRDETLHLTLPFDAEAGCLRICRQCCDWPLGFVHHRIFVRDVGQHSKWKHTYFARKIWFQTERIFAKACKHADETTVLQPSLKLWQTQVRLMGNEDVNMYAQNNYVEFRENSKSVYLRVLPKKAHLEL
jgi:hypothetical protein